MKYNLQTILKTVLLLTVYCSLSTIFAQAPEKMSYQAVIRDGSNTLVINQPIGMQVSILQGSSNGTEVFRELFNPNPQTNINGLVTVEIGTGIPLTGTFAGIDWANGPYFIKTETDPTGGTNYTIVGTSQLLSVPYALYAKTSGTLGWGLQGNEGTNASTDFIGTTDDTNLVFKRNNTKAGAIEMTNTSLGVLTLNSNTTGFDNVAVGAEVLSSNTTGITNTAVGSEALKENTGGSDNSAFGAFALSSNTTGISNTSIGSHSLILNTIGSSNTALGYWTLLSNTTGNNNVASGYRALYLNSTGSNNTASGYRVLSSNTTGYENTAVGSRALLSNTTGLRNTASGFEALESNTTGQYNSAFGYFSLASNTIGESNTAIGEYSLASTTAGNNNTALGRETLYTVTTGSNNLGLGYNAQVPSGTGSNQVRIGNTVINYAGIQVAWSVTSDSRWKENIQESDLGLNFITDLKPVFYTRKNDDTKKVEYGIIAQELEASLLKFGADTNGIITKDDEGMYSVRYNDLLAPMIKAIQEQQVMIETLKAEIQELKSRE